MLYISTKINLLCLQCYFVCYSFNIEGFRLAQTMAFAITEINRNPSLLPNVTLGYSLYDSCLSVGVTFRAALSMISGREKRFQLDQSCTGSPPVLGIVGTDVSKSSIAISRALGLYRVPLVSFLLHSYL